MNRLLVIDGACLFNRFYSKAEPMVIRAEKDIDKKNMLCRQMMKQKNGHYIEVLDGVVSQILRIQNHFLADYLVVVFDKNSQTTFRKLYYAGNKGHCFILWLQIVINRSDYVCRCRCDSFQKVRIQRRRKCLHE